MKLPLEVVVRGKKLPPRMQEAIAEHADRLDHFYNRVMRGRVTVEHQGQGWSLRIVLTVPDGTIVVDRQKGETLPQALREAFDAATRRLEDYVRRRRGQVKVHAPEE